MYGTEVKGSEEQLLVPPRRLPSVKAMVRNDEDELPITLISQSMRSDNLFFAFALPLLTNYDIFKRKWRTDDTGRRTKGPKRGLTYRRACRSQSCSRRVPTGRCR